MRTSSMIVLVWKHLRRRLLLRSVTMAAVCKEDVEYQVEGLEYYTQTFPLGLINECMSLSKHKTTAILSC